jgi:hypothetical protein
MAQNLADWAENAAIDWLCGGASPTRPTTRYLSLHTGAPGETGASSEVSGGGYARQAITFGAASAGTATNANSPSFTASGANFGTISHAAIFDASTSGNCLWQGALTSSKTINDGDTFQMPSGQLSVSLD